MYLCQAMYLLILLRGGYVYTRNCVAGTGEYAAQVSSVAFASVDYTISFAFCPTCAEPGYTYVDYWYSYW